MATQRRPKRADAPAAKTGGRPGFAQAVDLIRSAARSAAFALYLGRHPVPPEAPAQTVWFNRNTDSVRVRQTACVGVFYTDMAAAPVPNQDKAPHINGFYEAMVLPDAAVGLSYVGALRSTAYARYFFSNPDAYANGWMLPVFNGFSQHIAATCVDIWLLGTANTLKYLTASPLNLLESIDANAAAMVSAFHGSSAPLGTNPIRSLLFRYCKQEFAPDTRRADVYDRLSKPSKPSERYELIATTSPIDTGVLSHLYSHEQVMDAVADTVLHVHGINPGPGPGPATLDEQPEVAQTAEAVPVPEDNPRGFTLQVAVDERGNAPYTVSLAHEGEVPAMTRDQVAQIDTALRGLAANPNIASLVAVRDLLRAVFTVSRNQHFVEAFEHVYTNHVREDVTPPLDFIIRGLPLICREGFMAGNPHAFVNSVEDFRIAFNEASGFRTLNDNTNPQQGGGGDAG